MAWSVLHDKNKENLACLNGKSTILCIWPRFIQIATRNQWRCKVNRSVKIKEPDIKQICDLH